MRYYARQLVQRRPLVQAASPPLSTYKCAVIRKVYAYKRACSLTLSDFPSLAALPRGEERSCIQYFMHRARRSVARALAFLFSLTVIIRVIHLCKHTAVDYSQWMNSASRSIDSPISRCLLTCISARDNLSCSARVIKSFRRF